MVETFDQEKLISRSCSNYPRFSFLLQFAKTEFFGTPEILEQKYSDKQRLTDTAMDTGTDKDPDRTGGPGNELDPDFVGYR